MVPGLRGFHWCHHWNLHALASDPIATVEDDGTLREVADRSELYASRPVYAKVDSYGFSCSKHFTLSHGELAIDKMS